MPSRNAPILKKKEKKIDGEKTSTATALHFYIVLLGTQTQPRFPIQSTLHIETHLERRGFSARPGAI